MIKNNVNFDEACFVKFCFTGVLKKLPVPTTSYFLTWSLINPGQYRKIIHICTKHCNDDKHKNLT